MELSFFILTVFRNKEAADVDVTAFPDRGHGREATSLLSPAGQVRASRGQKQTRRCMGWKDKEHHREKWGVQISLTKIRFYRHYHLLYSAEFLQYRFISNLRACFGLCKDLKMYNSRIQNTCCQIITINLWQYIDPLTLSTRTGMQIKRKAKPGSGTVEADCVAVGTDEWNETGERLIGNKL